MAELTSCDFHHDLSESATSISSDVLSGEFMLGEATIIDDSMAEVIAADSVTSTSTTFLGDSGASHHICHKREYFAEFSPLSEPFKFNQVQGTVVVTYWGTVILEVDSESRKIPLYLTQVLLIDTSLTIEMKSTVVLIVCALISLAAAWSKEGM